MVRDIFVPLKGLQHLVFNSGILFLDWLPTKFKEPILMYYLTQTQNKSINSFEIFKDVL